MERIVNLVKENSEKELKNILSSLVEDGTLRNPNGCEIANLENIEVIDCKTKDGKDFNMIALDFITSDNKHYKKKISVDFARKVFTQFGVKSDDLYGSVWVIKPTGVYKNVGFFALVSVILAEDEFTVDGYELIQYVDESMDFRAKLKSLGL